MAQPELIIVGLSVTGLLAIWYFNLRIRRLRRYKKHADAFYAKARPLIEHPKTPLEILDTLQFMNQHITDRRAAHSMVRAITHAKNNLSEVEKIKARAKFAVMDTFFDDAPELQRTFSECLATGLLAISYNSGAIGFWGWLARKGFVSFVQAEKEVAAGVVRTYARSEQAIHTKTRELEVA
ncbi:hypothetical protein FMN63_24935 [Stappia sp. BW2]|uniref:hypothetical protein n=1 Tax=Stappia sp. BW2 TaxID=2592622 RepID=UPI0011DEBD73|nr:hypothetical protein [Stappia sp. BW2]TYC65632.1 hypothetical protein FMN63_24935 [Stappia sp. BW2]